MASANTKIHPTYKCRLCGETFQTSATTSTNYTNRYWRNDILLGKEAMSPLLDWHTCEGNKRGVADLIGLSPQEDHNQ